VHALVFCVTTECVGLSVCNTRLLCVCFHAIVRCCCHSDLEVLRICNLHALCTIKWTCIWITFTSP